MRLHSNSLNLVTRIMVMAPGVINVLDTFLYPPLLSNIVEARDTWISSGDDYNAGDSYEYVVN